MFSLNTSTITQDSTPLLIFSDPIISSANLRGKDLRKVCSEFEAIFLNYLLQQMRKTIPKSGLIEEGLTQEIYEEQWYTALAHKMAEEGGIGLAKILYRQLSKSKKHKEILSEQESKTLYFRLNKR